VHYLADDDEVDDAVEGRSGDSGWRVAASDGV